MSTYITLERLHKAMRREVLAALPELEGETDEALAAVFAVLPEAPNEPDREQVKAALTHHKAAKARLEGMRKRLAAEEDWLVRQEAHYLAQMGLI